MIPARILLVLAASACAPALAQETSAWIGAPDCRLAPVEPAPAQAPSWHGGCKNGVADGKGTLEWQSASGKRYRLEAVLAAGQVQGEGTLHYPDGAQYIGTLRNGIPDGRGYFRNADGDQYEGEVRMGEGNGKAELLYANGNDYNGEFKNGKRDGFGVMTWTLGGRYEGGWKDDKPHGPGKIVYAGNTGREVAVQDGRDPARKRGAESSKTYTVKEDQADTGTWIRRDIAYRIPVPPDLGFKELSPEQQAEVASWYPALAPGDEPPYPVNGPAEFYKAMSHVVRKTGMKGDITVYVLVGADGKVRSVTAVGLDDAEVRKIIATAAGLVQYKPAVCAGHPCDMAYPYRLGLEVKH
ncbi:hypothetical protein NX784_19740 [Massilia pinisoli]|uniref:MORN repeat protein n=1 Tax=Massilia pinisoli TaxID=1772194 RepID=A0ABT1ZVH5_9BURK|nr:hypothetical protein [Massilia pinisoli]MCS0583831.1 hypothetical protein [Massilia pinisoli]